MASRLPKEYIVRDGKIVDEKGRILCNDVPRIISMREDKALDTFLYELEFKNNRGRIVRELVNINILTKPSELYNKLHGKGLQITYDTKDAMANYFDVWLWENGSKLPSKDVYSTIGWHELGDELILVNPYNVGDEMEIAAKDEEYQKQFNRIKTKGTFDEWKVNVFDKVKDHKKCVFGILMALSSPFVQVAKVENQILSYSGTTSTGKTATLQIIFSTMGYSSQSKKLPSWCATRDTINKYMGMYGGFPFIIDDTANADFKDLVANCLYQFSSGSTKAKGDVDGLRPTVNFNGYMITNGEEPIWALTAKAGAIARTIELPNISYDGYDLAEICRNASEYYGRPMEWVFNFLAENKDNEAFLKWLNGRLLVNIRKFSSLSKNNVEGRIIQSFALAETVREILKVKKVLDIDDNLCVEVFKMVQEESVTDKPKAMLISILERISAKNKWIDTEAFNGSFDINLVVKTKGETKGIYIRKAYLEDRLEGNASAFITTYFREGLLEKVMVNGKKEEKTRLKTKTIYDSNFKTTVYKLSEAFIKYLDEKQQLEF